MYVCKYQIFTKGIELAGKHALNTSDAVMQFDIKVTIYAP